MLHQKSVRAEANRGVEMGRELMEDELAAICGGSANASDPSETGFGSAPGLSDLTNLLNPQGGATSPKNSASKNSNFPGLDNLGPLSGLTSGLFGKML